jgi:hypothetical protein
MTGDIIIKKSIIEKPEIAPIKPEKPFVQENKIELALPPVEVIKNVPRPPINKQDEKKNIVVSGQAQDWQKQQAAAIDNILAEGLNEVFLKMEPAQQANFKKVGEETTNQINRLLLEAKVKINKIMSLIRNWLKLIPGVNKFFLEQEVKIKTDKIIKIKNKF